MSLGQLVRRSQPELKITEIRDEDVELTQEEIDALIRYGKAKKAAAIREAAYRKKISSAPPVPTMTAEEYSQAIMKVAISRYGEFTLDKFNREIFQQLCLYFAGDERFQGSLKKGLLLVGPVGCGKTSLMELCWSNPHSSFRVIRCKDVMMEFTRDGFQAISKYSTVWHRRQDDIFQHEHLGSCFDDLGTEYAGRNYGNQANVMQDVLENRYAEKLPYTFTHVTTNLDFDQIGEAYGARVRSRIREMFNVIKFDPAAPDRRK